MEFLDSIDLYPKILVALTGLIAAFIKIKDTFSYIKRKQELKLDLEIFELVKNNGEFENKNLKRNIENKISNSFDEGNTELTNFFVGLVVFVGFGLWSIDIFQSYESFNGWIILTTFLSVSGLSMLFGRTNNNISKEAFLKIGFFDKKNFRFGFVITVVTGILTPLLIIKMDGFSFWQFLSGFFLLIGLRSFIQNIRRIN